MMRLTGAVAPAMQGVNNGAVACCCAAVDRNYGRVGDGFRTINFSGIETFFGASRVLPFRAARHPAVMRASLIEGAIFMLTVAMAIGVTMMVPEPSGKELNEIIV